MNSTLLQHWLDRIAPLGSDTYYALLGLEEEAQQACKIILAIFDNIMSIPFVIEDDELVRTKLRWWKQEIMQTQQQQASHPLCIALFPLMKKYALNYNALLQSISTLEQNVQKNQFTHEKSLCDYYSYTYGIRERMLAKITCAEAQQYAEAIHYFAYCLGLIDNLKHIRSRAKKMYVFFTDEEAKKLAVDKNLLLTLKISEPLKKLFTYHIEKAQQQFQQGMDLLSNKKALTKNVLPLSLSPLILRAHLGLQWTHLVVEAQFPLFTHHIELTPLRKWWYCWRYKSRLSSISTCGAPIKCKRT